MMTGISLSFKRDSVLLRHVTFRLRDKLIIASVLLITIPTLIIGYFVESEGRAALLREKSNKLYSVAYLLERTLNNEFGLGQGLPRNERLKLIGDKLYPEAEKITAMFQGVATGYYHQELDGIVTYSPRLLYGYKIGTSITGAHTGKQVLETGKPMTAWGSQVRGNIMNAMVPIKRNGQVIGYVWANELTDDIDRQALAMDIRVITVVSFGIVFSLFFIIWFSRRFGQDIDEIKTG